MRKIVYPAFSILLFAVPASAEDPSYFDHNYAATGIVRPETSNISPETNAPSRPADQMLQTEAPLPRKTQPSRGAVLQRPQSREGRFVSRQGGTEAVDIPTRLDETATVKP